jgi:hypothetical protein
LFKSPTEENLRTEVWQSLKKHLLAELENFLQVKKWELADEKTWRLMLFIANREEEGYLDYRQIENFSCPVVKQIDDYWVQNSKGNFGFSVQKKIWVDGTGNRGRKDMNEILSVKNYLRFASAVGWYNERQNSFVRYDELMKRINKDPTSPEVRGGLPRREVSQKPLLRTVLFSRCDL